MYCASSPPVMEKVIWASTESGSWMYLERSTAAFTPCWTSKVSYTSSVGASATDMTVRRMVFSAMAPSGSVARTVTCVSPL